MNVFLDAYVRLKACSRICTWKSTPSNQKHNSITSTVFTTTFGDTHFPATSGLKHFPTGSQPSFKFGLLEQCDQKPVSWIVSKPRDRYLDF